MKDRSYDREMTMGGSLHAACLHVEARITRIQNAYDRGDYMGGEISDADETMGRLQGAYARLAEAYARVVG